MNKNIKKLLILGGVIIAIILLIIADKSFKDRKAEEAGGNSNNSNTDIENPLNSELEDDSDDDSDTEKDGDKNSESDDANEAESDDANEAEDNNEAGSSSEDSTSDNSSNIENASYEKWLAAGVLTGVSMHYMDFELEGIYLASNTTLNAHDESKGVYVVFNTGGEKITIHSVPLKEERSEAGTIDLSTENFGMVTFDEVEVEDSVLKKCEEVRLENLSELISKLMLVTLYEH